MNLEELEEDELVRLRSVFVRLAERARRGVEQGLSDEDVPEIGELKDPPRQTPAP
jgi:hypothetical protein